MSDLPNGKAAGLDGLPYEFWKWLESVPIKPNDDSDDPLKLTKCIHKVFIDIQHHGVNPTTRFSEGWICPLYKKKDRCDIANYQPITLLNGDYKLFTKILALKLAHSAPHIIHENQAGFIPGRLITDQIWLTQMVLHYTKATEENGVVVALDQEKAYDKISHDYLWLTLDKYGIPASFTNTVKSLYELAESLVIINGEKSSFFRVTRGIRQGDPLSCLLFDISIEPLAETIRKSDLTGFKTNNLNRTIVSLFTDDTTVYLSEKDNVEDLYSILTTWCLASGAEFNIEKTKVIPISKKEYRDQVVHMARTNPTSATFDQNIHIAKDGQAIRILGAWIGNNINESAIWSPILKKIDSRLKRWDRKNPLIEGRKIIIQWTIGAMSQYLMCAQGMPPNIELALTKCIRSFIWDGEGKSNASINLLYSLTNKGGKGLLHLKHRNDAIKLVWLKKLLTPRHKRSTWTSFADAILAHYSSKTPVVKIKARTNYFLQTWNINVTKLPPHLRRIIKVVRSHNLFLDAPTFSPDLLRQSPIWFHIGATPALNRLNNHADALCLRRNHKVTLVGEMADTAEQTFTENHWASPYCQCATYKHLRDAYNCLNPLKCTTLAKDILQCLPPKWLLSENHNQPPQSRNETALEDQTDDSTCIFSPRLRLTTHLEDAFHIVRPKTVRHLNPARPDTQCVTPPHTPEGINLFCGTASKINEDGELISGGSACFSQDDDRNISFQPPHLSTPIKTQGS